MKTSLSILMVAPQPYFSARGTPFSVLHRIRALLALGHRVDLITYGYGEDMPMEGLKIIRCGRLPWVRRIKIGPSIAKIFLDILLFLKTRQALANKAYDVFHSHEEAAFFALPLLKNKSIPHVYDMHSSLPLQLSNFKAYNLGFLKSLFEKLENKVLLSCDAVITICDELGQIIDKGYPDKPHLMIENIGDDRMVFSANETDWIAKLAISDQPILLYTGTFEAYQGIDLFLDSMVLVHQKIPQAIAVLVGGNPEQVTHYAAYAKRLGIEDHVRFTGTVHPSNIPNLISLSTVIVSPRSRGTNTPLKIYNYMRSGKPLIATDRLTHTQILNNSVACLVDANKDAFALGILKVLSDKDYAQRLGNSARAFAEQHFSDENYIQMVSSIYKQMWDSLDATSVSAAVATKA